MYKIFLMILIPMMIHGGACADIKYPSAVVTQAYGGRFGDQLLLYYDAKYLAWLADLPFLYQPFEYSDQLMLDWLELRYSPDLLCKFHKILPAAEFLVENEAPTLYQVTFGEPIKFPQATKQNSVEFTEHMRRMISPKGKITGMELPTDRITVAVHVRKGGGFDYPLLSQQEYTPEQIEEVKGLPPPAIGYYDDIFHPTKFPPDQFYIDQIKRLSDLYRDAPLYVYIFTDDPNPENIKERYKKMVSKDNIVFESKKNHHNYKSSVIEDFFCMMKFDCLIRSSSSFSMMVDRLGYFKVSISPKKVRWAGPILVVDEVSMIINDQKNCPFL